MEEQPEPHDLLYAVTEYIKTKPIFLVSKDDPKFPNNYVFLGYFFPKGHRHYLTLWTDEDSILGLNEILENDPAIILNYYYLQIDPWNEYKEGPWNVVLTANVADSMAMRLLDSFEDRFVEPFEIPKSKYHEDYDGSSYPLTWEYHKTDDGFVFTPSDTLYLDFIDGFYEWERQFFED